MADRNTWAAPAATHRPPLGGNAPTGPGNYRPLKYAHALATPFPKHNVYDDRPSLSAKNLLNLCLSTLFHIGL